jgi:hypothetical protein
MDELELIRQLLGEEETPRPEARAAARAALVERFEGGGGAGERRWRRQTGWLRGFARPGWPRRGALVGVLGAGAAAVLVALGTSGPRIKTEVASGADLNRLAELAPHLEIAGGWQITHTEVSPDGGATRFHYEEDPARASGTTKAEIRWHAASVAELGRQLGREGLEPAGAVPVRSLDVPRMRAGEAGAMYSSYKGRAYVGRPGPGGFFPARALWREGRWTFELSAHVSSTRMIERLLERIEVLGREEWLVAIRPGGAKWLVDSLNGTVRRLENVKIRLPDGSLRYETRAIVKTSKPEERDFTTPFPVIRREGDTVSFEFESPPG